MRTIALAMWFVAAAAAAQSGPAGDRYFQAADGVTLRYRVVGQAPDTAIVLHGGPGLGLGSLAADLEPLAATVTLVLPDQRAAGRSSVPDTSALKLENYLSDIDALRQHLRLERVSLIGHSWGGALAGLYAARHAERVHRLVLLSPMYARLQPWAQQSQQRAMQRPVVPGSERIPQLVMAMATAPDPLVPCREVGPIMLQRMLANPDTKTRADLCDASAATLRMRASVPRHALGGIGPWDWREQLRSIRAPTLVVHGAEDAAPVESSREWAELIPGGKLLIVEGAAHLPHVEKPEIVFAAIREHFK